MPKVSALHLYPIKGCAGLSVSEMTLDARGPVGDRRFMIVDEHGMFMTQRSHARMALIRPQLTSTEITLDAPGMPTLTLPLDAMDAARLDVQVWRSKVSAATMGPFAYQWLSDFLGTAAELVRMDDQSVRTASTEYAPPGTHVTFADAYPLLLISEASLEQLNTKLLAAGLDQPLPMNRFRPNVVVSGTEPHAEDSWASVRVRQVELWIVKSCDRCTVTTIDQTTAVAGNEPLKTLSTYRKHDSRIYFGQNLVHRGLGTLRVGDDVDVLRTQTPLPFGEPVT